MIEYSDFRDFIRLMEDRGELKHVKKEVDWDQEIASVFIKSSKRNNRALMFEKIKGSSIPLVIGNLASSERIRLAVGKSEDEMDSFIQEVLNTKREEYPPQIVSSGVSQEVVLEGDDIDLFALPIPKFAEKEGGRYITAGVSITKDPERGTGNAGVYRMMVRDRNEINVNFGFPNRHMLIHAKKAKKTGKPLPVAIAIGCDPALWLCASFPFPAKIDEMVQAGVVMEKGVELVKAKTIDLNVPANAEFILECEMDIDDQKPEGPYTDFQGYYTNVKDNYVLKVKAITHRKDPIYETSMTGHVPEGEMELYRNLLVRQQKLQVQKVVPQVVDMTFDAASRGHNYVVSVRNKRPFLANQVGAALLSFPWAVMAKMVIVVDDDVDVEDASEVQWALATRVDWENDLTMLSSMAGPSFDVGTGRRSRTSKPIIDATRKLETEGYPGKFPEAGKPSQAVIDSVVKNWSDYGLD